MVTSHYIKVGMNSQKEDNNMSEILPREKKVRITEYGQRIGMGR